MSVSPSGDGLPKTELVDPTTIKDHPQRHLVPTVSPEQYEVIKADVKANGFRTASIVNQRGETVDGHTRKRIAVELETELLIERRDLTRSEEMQHLVLNNLSRRHLTLARWGDVRAALLPAPTIPIESAPSPQKTSPDDLRMRWGLAPNGRR